jgi:hypothetical protein
VDIASSGATVKIGDPTNFVGTISNFIQGDTIDLAGIGTASAATLDAGNVLTVQGTSSGSLALKLDPSQDYSGRTFSVAPDGSGGTNVTLAGVQTDLSFVIDTTGSMGPYIDAVKADANSLISTAFAGGANTEISVVSFKDPQAGYPDSVVLPFTTQTDFGARQTAAVNAINSLGADGGGDIPEGDYSGLLLALNGSAGEWRDSSEIRRIVLFTDAPVKDTDLAPTVNEYANDLGTVVSATGHIGNTLDRARW